MTACTTSTTPSLATTSEPYKQLMKKLEAITQLKRISAVLSYDEMVFMSSNDETVSQRGLQKATLAELVHEKSTDAEIGKLVNEIDFTSATTDEKRLLEITKKDFEQKQRVPKELASKAALLSSKANAQWVKSRKDNDFASFEPLLKECFDVAKELAAAKRSSEEVPLYTQMLDEFEVGMPMERIDAVFSEIQGALVPLIAKVLASENKPDTSPLKGKFPIETQKQVSQSIVSALGYNENQGRIDVSVHPFTMSLSPKDVRITSRFSDSEWYQGLAGTIHESGHAMYEQNLQNSPYELDSALSMGAHESQSLFWERHVGLSRNFWKWAQPKMKESYDNYEYSAEELYRAVNHVRPSFIRVEADELTYPLHVILRYKIEKDVVGGTLDVKDIPKRWNAEMKELLNVDVESDSLGCLQDVHWSMQAIGYFPTYLIGSSTAAQLAHYCAKDVENFDSKIECGDFKEIKEWLTKKIHVHGKRYKSLDDMLENEIGEKLNPKYFIDYLTNKYTDIYKL